MTDLAQRCRALALLAALLVLVSLPALGQAELQAPEPRVKAAFLVKFGSYVEWPPGTFASPEAPFTIGIIDADAIAAELDAAVADRNIDGRPVQVRKLGPDDSVDGLNVLFVGRAGTGKLAGFLPTLRAQATLAVTESDGALRLGSNVNFVVVDGKVRFDVAVPPAQTGKLRISSRLLAVARRVQGER